jgi:uncharacterized protein (DUF983 family)
VAYKYVWAVDREGHARVLQTIGTPLFAAFSLDGWTVAVVTGARRGRSSDLMIGTALRRGWRKRCPHCGEGPILSGWSHLERCSRCGLLFARHPGDMWAFTIIGNRVPIAAMIVLIYVGVVRSHRALGLTLLVGLASLVVWTAPNRWGVSVALHYLSRVYWPDPADPIPPPPATRPAE